MKGYWQPLLIVLVLASCTEEGPRTAEARGLEQLASSGSVRAQTELGTAYENGWGVKQDYHQAYKWFAKAAKQGNPAGMYHLGILYASGKGVNQNFALAKEWFEKAAKYHESGAEVGLGDLYYRGNGVSQDYLEAKRWYESAAENNETAQLRLGELFEKGAGVAQDLDVASSWYKKACTLGSKEGCKRLAVLKNLPSEGDEEDDDNKLDLQGGEVEDADAPDRPIPQE